MFRLSLALLTLIGGAATADAQPGNLPLSPGVRSGSSIGPGTQFLSQPNPRFRPIANGVVGGTIRPRTVSGGFFPGAFAYPGFGYGYGFGYGGWMPGYGNDPHIAIEIVPPHPPQLSERMVVLANEFPAALTVQFPAAASVWLNGQEVKGEASEERVLTSPVLKPGETFSFTIKARWTRGGKTYETSRTVTLGAGDRSRLIVVSGTEVK